MTTSLWPTPKTLIEHAADALAAVVAGIEGDIVRAAVRARCLALPPEQAPEAA